jgi:hypothetical protein
MHPTVSHKTITNFILIKYTKKSLDAPDHIKYVPKIGDWNDCQETMFRIMIEQLNYFYPKSTIHIITNEKNKNTNRLIWHYNPNLETNHNTKLMIYGLLDAPAMYIDTDILIVRPFKAQHLSTSSPFNLYQYSNQRNLQNLCRKKLELTSDKQYNCGLVWIPRPSKQIVAELWNIKNSYFNDRELIEQQHAFYNNDEHPISYFVAKYNLHMKMFKIVNAFRYKYREEELPNMQSIHYTGIKNKALFTKEYKSFCKMRVKILC